MNGAAEGYFNMIMLQRNLLFQEGVQLKKEGDYWRAQQKFKTILFQIFDIEAQFQLACCYQFSKDYPRAIKAYQKVFDKNPTDPRPLYQQGYIYDQQNIIDRALSCFQHAAKVIEEQEQLYGKEQIKLNKIYSKYSKIYYALGCAHTKLKRLKDAENAFQRCVEFDNHEDKAFAIIHINTLQKIKTSLDFSQTQQFKKQPYINQMKRSNDKQSPDPFLREIGINPVLKNPKKISNSPQMTNSCCSQLSTAERNLSIRLYPPLRGHDTCTYNSNQEPSNSEKALDQHNSDIFDKVNSHLFNSNNLSHNILSAEFPFKFYKKQLNEGSNNNTFFRSSEHPLYPNCVDDESIDSEQNKDNCIPDEKEGLMMRNAKEFKNVHVVKSIPMKTTNQISNSRQQLVSYNSQISSSSSSKTFFQEYSTSSRASTAIGYGLKKVFEHSEKTIDVYEKIKKLGEGSFGTVFEVTYKIIPSNSMLKQNLTNGEIDIMKQLNHQNVIKIYNAFKSEDQQSYCIVSELADNGNLKEFIQKRRGKIDKSEALNMMKQLITALHYIHSHRIIHRDIKPGNIFLNGISNQIKIGDFGIAKKLSKKDVQQTLQSLGTEKYFSPEYMKEGFSTSSDIWSMGIVFLELIGVSVQEGMTDRNRKMYLKQIPPEMSEIIAGMTHNDPSIRSTSNKVINQLQMIQ